MAALKYLLDTHALIWAATDDDRLSPKAARAIHTTPYERLGISDIVLQEIGLLLQAGRITLNSPPASVFGPWLDHVTVLPITLDIALAAPALPLPHPDQFDRIIAATAKAHRLPLITRDANIADAGVIATIW